MKILLLCTLICWVSPAHAEDYQLTPIPAGEDVIVPLVKGAAAPFGGQLFDTNTAIRWGLWLQRYQALMGAELDRSKAVCTAQVAFKDQVLGIEQDKSEALQKDLAERLQRAETGRLNAEHELAHPPWYESGAFHFALGIVTAGAVVYVGAKAF